MKPISTSRLEGGQTQTSGSPTSSWITLYGSGVRTCYLPKLRGKLPSGSTLAEKRIDAAHVGAHKAVQVAGRKMKNGAHLLLIAHGSTEHINGKRATHHVQIPDPNAAAMPTNKLLSGILEPLAARRRAKGLIEPPFVIVQSCKAGSLRDTILPGTDLWKSAYFLIVSGRRNTTFMMGEASRDAAMSYVSQCESRGERPDPYRLLAIAGQGRRDSVTLMGGDLEQPLVWHAPKAPTDLEISDVVTRIRGSKRDKSRLEASLQSMTIEQMTLIPAPSIGALVMNRIIRDDVAALKSILDEKASSIFSDTEELDLTLNEFAVFAAETPAPQCLALLLKKGVNPRATKDGKSLIEIYAKCTWSDGQTALDKTGLKGLQALLEAGADPNKVLPGEPTPLMRAASAGDLASMRLLMDHGALLDKDYAKRNPLQIAAAKRDTHELQRLLNHGAGVADGLSSELIDQCTRDGNLIAARMLADALNS